MFRKFVDDVWPGDVIATEHAGGYGQVRSVEPRETSGTWASLPVRVEYVWHSAGVEYELLDWTDEAKVVG